MRTDRNLAIELRKAGKSYKEINKLLKIPLGTLSSWFKSIEWSQEVKELLLQKSQELAKENLRLMSLANKEKWNQWHQKCRDIAKEEYSSLIKKPIFIAGLMLYWGEGDKTLKNGIVRLVNSESEMIKVFYYFLYDCLDVPKDKIIIKLTLYPDLDDKVCQSYWGNFLNVSHTHNFENRSQSKAGIQ